MFDLKRLPGFEEPLLALAAERLTEQQLDGVTFGAIRLDPAGIVRVYNATERALSGSGERPRIGLDFFTQIAPCMNNPGFRGRIDRAREAGRLDIEFEYVGDFADTERDVTVRIQSASDGGCWIFIRRDS